MNSKNVYNKRFFGDLRARIFADNELEKQARHYASMIIDDKDLCMLSCSENQRDKSAHNSNLITFQKILNFRELIYKNKKDF
jgi:hypothetical protein